MATPVMVAFQELGWLYVIPLILLLSVACWLCKQSQCTYNIVNLGKVIILVCVALAPIANMVTVGLLILYFIISMMFNNRTTE